MGLVNTNKKIDKNMIKVCILDILEDAAENNPLAQGAIKSKLESIYGIQVDRKTVHRNLRELIASIDCIRYKETFRGKNDDSAVLTDFWIEHEPLFEDVELLALINNVIFSKHMPARAKKDIVKKLESLSPDLRHKKFSTYLTDPTRPTQNYNQFFWNLELLNEAIENKSEVSFRLSESNAIGETKITNRRLQVFPLGIGCSDGDYYLVAYRTETEAIWEEGGIGKSVAEALSLMEEEKQALKNKDDYLETFRLDKIYDIKVVDESELEEWELEAKDFGPALKDPRTIDFDMKKYMSRNPRFRDGYITKAIIGVQADDETAEPDLVDFFGVENVEPWNGDQGFPEWLKQHKHFFLITSNNNAICEFALDNADRLEVYAPKAMRDKVLDTIDAYFTKMLTMELEVDIFEEGMTAAEAKQAIMYALSQGIDEILNELNQ